MYTEAALRRKFVTLFARSLGTRVDHAAQHRKMLFVLVALPLLFAILMPIVASVTVIAVYALAISEAVLSLYFYLQVLFEDKNAVSETLSEIYVTHPEYRERLLFSASAQWADAEPVCI